MSNLCLSGRAMALSDLPKDFENPLKEYLVTSLSSITFRNGRVLNYKVFLSSSRGGISKHENALGGKYLSIFCVKILNVYVPSNPR